MTPAERAVWVRRNQQYHDNLLRLAEFVTPPDASVLQLGCGTGELIGRLKRKQKVGVESRDGYVAYARDTYPDTRFVVAKEESESDLLRALGTDRFDLVVLSDTLSYTLDIQAVLTQAARRLTPSGRILVTVYNNLWEPLFWLGGLLRLRSPSHPDNWLDDRDLKNLFHLAGLEVVTQSSHMLIPFYIPLLSAFFNRIVARLWPFRGLAIYESYVLRAPVRGAGAQRVSIIVPARNEAGTLPDLVRALPHMAPQTELIFVEGHSTDNTWDVLVRLEQNPPPGVTIRVLKQTGIGKADAVHAGFTSATGDVLMILDADLSVSPEELPRFFSALVEGRGEFINGSRLVYRIDKGAMPILNMLGNRCFGKAFSFLLGQTFKDTLCGTKVLWRKDWQRIMDQRAYFGDFDPFGDFELLFGAAKLNMKIVSLPVHYRARVYGATNIQRFRHALLLFKMCAIAARRITFA